MLRDKLNDALKDAMRARDQSAVGAIRLILAKLKEVDIAARTETSREGVADDRILSMMQSMIKQRNESVALYEKGGRPELAEKEKAEIAVIERFLPSRWTRLPWRPPSPRPWPRPAPRPSRTWAASWRR